VVEFEKKVVAITGAAGGIGQSMCRHFGSLGATIAALDISLRVTNFVEGLRAAGITSAPAVVDIGDPGQVKAGFAGLVAALGPVDILINNAGFSQRPSLNRSTPETWREEVNGNLNGAFNCAYAVLPDMQKRQSGAIVNIGSVNGLYALGDPAYSAAKAGLINFTKALAMEYGCFGIRANIILPGTVRTPLWEERASRNPKILNDLVRWYPLGRIVDPIDVAKAAAFLASDAAAAITGAVLPVDCGLSAGNIAMARELTLEPY
jgi:NAD(P)-dependent dehydrogenase (short-subunit alcohol dehydrogenase family)